MTFRDDDGNELEISGTFALNKRSVSLFDGDIIGDYSTNFEVDNNSRNREILGYQGLMMTNQIAYVKQPFSRIRNGTILDRGFIIIQRDLGETISCFYVSGNSNWFQLLKGLITDLDYTGITSGEDYTTQISFTNVAGKVSSTKGVIFPMVDFVWGYKKGNKNYFMFSSGGNVVDSRNDPTKYTTYDTYPAFYLHSLVQEATTQNGIKRDGNLFSDPIYNSLIVPAVRHPRRRNATKIIRVAGATQTISALSTEQYISFTLDYDLVGLWNDTIQGLYLERKYNISAYFVIVASVATMQVSVAGASSYSFPTTANIPLRSDLISFSPVSIPNSIFINVTNATPTPRSITIDMYVEIPELVNTNDFVTPDQFLPTMSCLDVVKFPINLFGCSVYFNDVSKTLSINIIEKMKLEDAQDWSDFYIAHTTDYLSGRAKNNYIEWAENTKNSDVVRYNDVNKVKFGHGNIETQNTTKEDATIATLAFAPTPSDVSKNGMLQANVPIINLIDDGDPVSFTAVAFSSTGIASFSCDGSLFAAREIIRVVNSSGVDLGYFVTSSAGSPTSLLVYFDFVATFSGKIYKQTINYQDTEPRVLSVKPSTQIVDLATDANALTFYDETATKRPVSNMPFAVFSKFGVRDTIDQWKNNLAIDNPSIDGYTDPTIKELYYNKISKMVNNPLVPVLMMIPEAVYQSYKFDRFIFIHAGTIRGYFFPKEIKNYVDGSTPVEIDFYML